MKHFFAVLGALWALHFSAGAVKAETIRVVATLSTFADLVEKIGGEDVEVSFVAPPRFNPHFIEPRPGDVLKVRRADLFVHAGLDLEPWRYPLVDAAGKSELRPGGQRELDLSQGVRLLEVPAQVPTRAAGDIHIYGNPHYWLIPDNVRVMAVAIAEKLSEVDPVHSEAYQGRLRAFLDELDRRVEKWRQDAQGIRGKEAVAYHNDLVYLAEFLGLRVAQYLEPKPGIPPTPRQIQFLEGYIAERGIGAILQASFYPRGSSDSLARKTGAEVVLLCQNVGERPECGDYFALMDYNLSQLTSHFR
ncbi:MAG: zinc ABC transporter substrate-binding protein [Candidatus Omnitrophica bacterium]|nr:zinc ABC transporter substrate-binding protein [Candidatus Omnitrophota bacterium]